MDEINYKTVLQYMSIQDHLTLWSNILNRHVSIGQVFTSPFRRDTNPGCFLYERSNIIWFQDYGSPNQRWNILHAISYFTGKGLKDSALKAYASLYFNKPLQLNSNQVLVGQAQKGRTSNTKILFNSYKHKGKPCWTKKSFEYWDRAGVKLQDLIDLNVYDCQSFYLNENLIVPKGLCFSYYFPLSSHCKIYQPDAIKKEDKFIGTCNKNDIWKTNVDKKKLLITKSAKDLLTLKNILPKWELWSFQSEGTIPDSLTVDDFKEVYILYDGDDAGRRTAKALQEHLGLGNIIFFESEFKDAYGIASNRGIDILKKEIKNLL